MSILRVILIEAGERYSGGQKNKNHDLEFEPEEQGIKETWKPGNGLCLLQEDGMVNSGHIGANVEVSHPLVRDTVG